MFSLLQSELSVLGTKVRKMALRSKFSHLKLLDLILKQAVSIDVFHEPEVTLFVALVFKHFNDSVKTSIFFFLLLGD